MLLVGTKTYFCSQIVIDQPTAVIMLIPKIDQFQISPVASPEILQNTTQYKNFGFS